jgi:hypothetical protein
MPLSRMETMLLQGGEDCRKRALDAIDAGGDLIIIAQDLQDAGDSYRQAAIEIALRVRKEQVSAMKKSVVGMKEAVRG